MLEIFRGSSICGRSGRRLSAFKQAVRTWLTRANQVEGSYYARCQSPRHSEVSVRLFDREIESWMRAACCPASNSSRRAPRDRVRIGFQPSREERALLANVEKIGPARVRRSESSPAGRPGQRAIMAWRTSTPPYRRADSVGVRTAPRSASPLLRRCAERAGRNAAASPPSSASRNRARTPHPHEYQSFWNLLQSPHG